MATVRGANEGAGVGCPPVETGGYKGTKSAFADSGAGIRARSRIPRRASPKGFPPFQPRL